MRPILFHHIPRTGGTTLRIILNRVYGTERVFHIRSKDIAASLSQFSSFDEKTRSMFRVIAGHGATFFESFIPDPFHVSILREPVSLFHSQFHYLRVSNDSIFLEEVRSLRSMEDYLDYAIEKGQDNLLTRYFSDSLDFLVNPGAVIPDMEKEGMDLLESAKQNLRAFDALLDLSTFEKGVFALSRLLEWQGIPLFRPSNRMRKKAGNGRVQGSFREKLKHSLRFDLELYDYFREEKLDLAHRIRRSNGAYGLFRARQSLLNASAFLLRRS